MSSLPLYYYQVYMPRNLSHVLLASPPSWNTVSQHPTVVAYCTVLYGTGVQESICTGRNSTYISTIVPDP